MTQPNSNPDSPTARDLVWFLMGDADAIRRLASHRATFATGALLVLFTAVARHYDQTWIGENPVFWFIGPLLFSIVSGTWHFMVLYLGYMRSRWPETPESRNGAWRDWPTFMGLFWMTAPIGWLYALPVERVLDPVASAWANVSLMGFVSLWRVALFSRVIAVIARVRYLDALTWVLVAASVETFVVLFFGSLGMAIGKGMAGLRYSPVEEVMRSTVNVALTGAMILGPAALLFSGWRHLRIPVGSVDRLKPPLPGRLPWRLLGACAASWTLLAALVQPAVRRSAHLDALVHARNYPEALDYLRSQRPDRFAPARPLPPQSHEFRTAEDLEGLLSQLRTNDPPWIQNHLLGQLDSLEDSRRSRWKRSKASGPPTVEDYRHSYLNTDVVLSILDHAARFPAGRLWITNNPVFVEAMESDASERTSKKSTRTSGSPNETPQVSPVPPRP